MAQLHVVPLALQKRDRDKPGTRVEEMLEASRHKGICSSRAAVDKGSLMIKAACLERIDTSLDMIAAA